MISFFFLSTEMYIYGKLRESWRWLKCRYTGLMVWFFCETSLPFCFILPGLKSFQVYLTFWTPTQSSGSHIPPMCCTWTHLLSYKPPTQLPQLLCIGNTCILFTFGNRCTSSCFLLPVSNPSSMPPTQFLQHFRWGICLMVTLGNRFISCYATHTIYAACQKGLSGQYSTFLPILFFKMFTRHFSPTLSITYMVFSYLLKY